MMINDSDLSQALLAGNYLRKEDIFKATTEAHGRRISLFSYLVESNKSSIDLIGQALAEYFKMTYADLNSQRPAADTIGKIPEEIVKKLRLILFYEDKDKVVITTDDPENVKYKDKLKQIFPNKEVVIAYSVSSDIDNFIVQAYRQTLETRFSKIIAESDKIVPEIINEIFSDAYDFKASDIHFEPQEKEVIVRFRVDGVLQEAGRLPKNYYDNIINRLKVQANLRIDEHYAAQDGSFRFINGQKTIDVRLSIVPISYGEKMVMRLMAEYMRGFNLKDLGLQADSLKILESASHKPFGMILVTGPTGSGKSTTLYAILKKLNNSTVNITTIEDPVEVKLAGVNQIQVNSQTDLTFAKGLRSIVRQDPDIILVGEIRDEETAEIAVNAALTGHLLLSTFHANDAATAIPRLIDMGIEPFLLSSTLELIVAQRLSRRICDNCRYSQEYDRVKLLKEFPQLTKFFKNKKITLYRGRGCPVCSYTGYHGRVGLFELIPINQEIKDLIMKSPSARQIEEIAGRYNFKTMFEDGLDKVASGLITIDELLRVANPPQ